MHGGNKVRKLDFLLPASPYPLAGIISTVLNNIYSLIHAELTGFSIPEIIHFGFITELLSPTIIGALGYFVLSRFTNKATLIYISTVGVLTILSCYGPLQGVLPEGTATPDGFAGPSLPMHFITGLVAIVFIPKYTFRK